MKRRSFISSFSSIVFGGAILRNLKKNEELIIVDGFPVTISMDKDISHIPLSEIPKEINIKARQMFDRYRFDESKGKWVIY